MLSQMKWARTGLAALIVVALLSGGLAWAAPPEGKGKPPKPPQIEAQGTIYFNYDGMIYGMDGLGNNKQVIAPHLDLGVIWPATEAMPSRQVYGPDVFMDRWWLRVKADGRTYDKYVYANGTFETDYPHYELYAIMPYDSASGVAYRMALEVSQLLPESGFIVAARFAEVLVGLGAAFDEAGLEAVGAIAHRVRGHGG